MICPDRDMRYCETILTCLNNAFKCIGIAGYNISMQGSITAICPESACCIGDMGTRSYSYNPASEFLKKFLGCRKMLYSLYFPVTYNYISHAVKDWLY